MEDWEESHVDKNLRKLIKNTRCTLTLKILLKASGILTEEDIQELEAEGDRHGAQRETKALYNFLKTRRGAYEALMKALEETRQTGAYDILKAGQRYRNSDANENTLVEKFMEIPVELLGSVQSLRQHFPCIQKDTIIDLLHCERVKRELGEGIERDGAFKLIPDLPELQELYIPRQISNRLLLDPTIFKINCPDIFVFKGVERGALVNLASPHVVRMSTTQLSCMTCRHIYLDDEEDWDDLVLVTKEPLHLVYKDTDGYILQRSTQVTSILHEHWLEKTRKSDAYLSEDKFVSQFIGEKHGKGALVCDVPGMGKSWLLLSISRRIQISCSRTVVLFIQLTSFAKYLAEQNKFPEGVDSLSQVLQFLNDTKLAAYLLRLYAEKNGLNVVLVFDGFDEVSHAHIENVTLFLRNISTIKYVRFIISSRPNMRAHLEKTFNLISYDILPFGKQEQVASLVNHWKKTILTGDDKKISEFAVQCIDSFRVIRQKDRFDILGVPLQCYLLAVVNETTARQVSNPYRKKEFVIHDVAKVDSICKLYTLFFNGLILKGIAEPNNSKACYMKTVERFHTHKALELLFPEIAPVFSKTFKTETAIEDLVAKFGVLYQSRQSKLEFVHRSLAEFLAGKFFAEFWMDIKSQKPSVVKSIGSYFLLNVLKLSDRTDSYRRHYAIDFSSGKDPLYIQKDVVSFDCSTVLWFMNSLYRKQPEDGFKHFAQTLCCQQKLLQGCRRLATSILKQKDVFMLCKETIREFSYENIIGFVNLGFSSLLCLLVSLIKTFFREEKRLALLAAYETQRIATLQTRRLPLKAKRLALQTQTLALTTKLPDLPYLLCYIAAHGCPENASEVFDLFGGPPQNCLLKFCSDYPEQFWTPMEVAVSNKNLEMVLFFDHKIKRNEERLLQIFLPCRKLTEADMNANILVMETVFGSVSKMLSRLSVVKFQPVDESLVNMMNLAWTWKCSLSHVSLENKKSCLKMALEEWTDEKFIKLLLLLFPVEQNDRFYFSHGLKIDETGHISEYTREVVLQNVNLDGIKLALPNDVDFISPLICNIETLKILMVVAPNFASVNKFGRNYLHFAVLESRFDWVEHLIESGYDVNERDTDGNTPINFPRRRDCDNSWYPWLTMCVTLSKHGARRNSRSKKLWPDETYKSLARKQREADAIHVVNNSLDQACPGPSAAGHIPATVARTTIRRNTKRRHRGVPVTVKFAS